MVNGEQIQAAGLQFIESIAAKKQIADNQEQRNREQNTSMQGRQDHQLEHRRKQDRQPSHTGWSPSGLADNGKRLGLSQSVLDVAFSQVP